MCSMTWTATIPSREASARPARASSRSACSACNPLSLQDAIIWALRSTPEPRKPRSPQKLQQLAPAAAQVENRATGGQQVEIRLELAADFLARAAVAVLEAGVAPILQRLQHPSDLDRRRQALVLQGAEQPAELILQMDEGPAHGGGVLGSGSQALDPAFQALDEECRGDCCPGRPTPCPGPRPGRRPSPPARRRPRPARPSGAGFRRRGRGERTPLSPRKGRPCARARRRRPDGLSARPARGKRP